MANLVWLIRASGSPVISSPGAVPATAACPWEGTLKRRSRACPVSLCEPKGLRYLSTIDGGLSERLYFESGVLEASAVGISHMTGSVAEQRLQLLAGGSSVRQPAANTWPKGR
jgi:hypothetical protein